MRYFNSLLFIFLFFEIFNCNEKNSIPIKIEKEITLRLKPGAGNPRNSEGDFIQLKDGRLLFIYTHFTGGDGDHAAAYLAGRFSSDSGKSWTDKDVIVLPNEGNMNIMSVSLLRLADNRIALFYLRKNSDKDCIPLMRISTNEAETWSDPIECINSPGYYVMNNDRAVRLTNNRILLPCALHNMPDSEWTEIAAIICYFSDDNGANWIKSEKVTNPSNAALQEPGIVELTDGKLMMFCRTNAGSQYISYSSNSGESWTSVQPSNIVSPMSPASIERIPGSGDLLLVWNNNYDPGDKRGGKRTPFNLAISHDEGEHWEEIKTLEDDANGWYCYAAIECLPDNILLAYCAGNRKNSNGLETIHVARIDYDWIYAD